MILPAGAYSQKTVPASYNLLKGKPKLGAFTMLTNIDAVYEDGVLKPVSPLPLKEHEKVRMTVEPKISLARKTAGMLVWSGDAETIRRLAEDPEFGISESA